MGKISGGQTLIYIYILLTVVFVDLITKELAESLLSSGEVRVLPFLKLFLIYNKGAAFGIFSDLPDLIRIPLLTITPVIAFLVTYFYSSKEGKKWITIAMGLIGGGALGNLYDRLFLGKVRDFIHLHVGDHYWPAFNIADASITLAIFIVIAGSLKK